MAKCNEQLQERLDKIELSLFNDNCDHECAFGKCSNLGKEPIDVFNKCLLQCNCDSTQPKQLMNLLQKNNQGLEEDT